MLKDLLEILQELMKKILGSRLFALAVVFTMMFATLIMKLFQLQIVHGEEFQNEYVRLTEKTVTTPGTRGNIYDRNGYLLAYNEPAYSVTVQDTGAYPNNAAMNAMLLRLIHILNKHGYQIQGKLEIGLDESGQIVYTSTSEAARKRFLRDYYGVRSVDDLDDEKGEHPSAVSPRELLEMRVKRYDLDKIKDELGNPVILTDGELVQLINIRYTMSLVAYKNTKPQPLPLMWTRKRWLILWSIPLNCRAWILRNPRSGDIMTAFICADHRLHRKGAGRPVRGIKERKSGV